MGRKDPARQREYMEEWKRKNPNYFRDYNRQWKKRNPRGVKNLQLKCKFGITLDEYEQRLAEQNGVCVVCKSPPPPKKALAVDHCHESGLVRGLLCDSCNTALGLLRECPARMNALKEYISKFSWLK